MNQMNEELSKYYLEHYGVKGMKWGVRKQRRMEKKDSSWRNKLVGGRGRKILNKSNAEMNRVGIKTVNDRWRGKDLRNKKTQKAYMDDMVSEYKKILNKNLGKQGLSPSGKLVATYISSPDGTQVAIDFNEVKHADGSDLRVIFKLDAKGFVTSVEMDSEEVAQSAMDYANEFLEHHGKASAKKIYIN